MKAKKTILLKLTGEILLAPTTKSLTHQLVHSIASQIKKLQDTHRFGIVIGGGNFFRGSHHGKALGINSSVGHQIGMLATVMNGLIVKDLFEQADVPSALFCAVPSNEIGKPISHQGIKTALNANKCPIFTGGTGNPFFTTDTTAILRGLQIEADEIWKGTHVPGVYDSDPRKNPNAQLIKELSHEQALSDQLGIMDATAFALAQQYNLAIRIFNIFENNALLNVATNNTIGSTIT